MFINHLSKSSACWRKRLSNSHRKCHLRVSITQVALLWAFIWDQKIAFVATIVCSERTIHHSASSPNFWAPWTGPYNCKEATSKPSSIVFHSSQSKMTSGETPTKWKRRTGEQIWEGVQDGTNPVVWTFWCPRKECFYQKTLSGELETWNFSGQFGLLMLLNKQAKNHYTDLGNSSKPPSKKWVASTHWWQRALRLTFLTQSFFLSLIHI